jgi:hypothetical protein
VSLSIMRQVFICDAIRTPIGRYGGTPAGIRPDDLGAIPLQALMQIRASIGPRSTTSTRLRESGRRGQSQRRAHGGIAQACRTACRAQRSIVCAAPVSMR